MWLEAPGRGNRAGREGSFERLANCLPMDETVDVRTIIVRYWRAYGGWHAVLRSPFIWLAALLLIPTFHFWARGRWWEVVIACMPNILGFSLGAMAILLGLGDERFLSGISGSREGHASPYLRLAAMSLHVVLMQSLALLLAILARSLDFRPVGNLVEVASALGPARPVVDAVCFFFFLYTLCSLMATGIAFFNVAYWLDWSHSAARAGGDDQPEPAKQDRPT